MRNELPRGSTDALEFKCTGPKGTGSAACAWRLPVRIMWILSFFTARLPQKAKKIEILPRFERWMKKMNILRASFIILKIWELLMQKLKQESPKARGHRRFYQPIEKCKHKQEDCYWYELPSPLHGSYWYEKWENWKLTTFCGNFVWTHARKTEKNTSQQQFPVFSAVYSDT